MTFSLSYEIDFQRVMSAVINDSRNTIPATKGAGGIAIYAYIQSQIALVTPQTIIYRIVGGSGNLGGYCGILVQGGRTSLQFYQLRPAFQQFESEILGIISIFISQNAPLQDVLY
jgi:hypothetical protein